jgi:predicted RNA methylase
MAQDTGKFRKNTKDQYYTKSCVAKKCVDAILAMYPLSKDMLWIEPSAGNGAFLRALPNTVTHRVGIDIDPKSVDIIKANFLEWVPVENKKKVVTIYDYNDDEYFFFYY